MNLNDYKNFHRLTLRQMSDDTGLSITLLSKLCNGRCPMTKESHSVLTKTYGIEFEGLQEPKILHLNGNKCINKNIKNINYYMPQYKN